MDYPRSLYKTGGKLKWGKDKYYSTILVKNEKEHDKAREEGFIDSFAQALEPVEEIKNPSWKELATECGLKGEELKKFMKKNVEQKQKQLEKLKD